MSGQGSRNNPFTAVNRRLARLFAPKRAATYDPPPCNADETTFHSSRKPNIPQMYDKSKQAVYILRKQELVDETDSTSSDCNDHSPNVGTIRQDNSMNSSLAIYAEHFNLNMRPFSLLPDPDFMFWSVEHRRAYTMLEYGIVTCAPITLITGEVGSGKTTLLRHLLNNIEIGIKIGLVSNAHGSRGELLRWVLMSLDQSAPKDATYVDLFEQFQSYLIQEYAQGNRVVIIFDEAQNLSRESLEELRMFTNINANKDELIQLVLVGQPELRDMIRRPDLKQFAQRVAANFHLGSMDASAVQAYIGHRLHRAGATKNLFNRHACNLIFEQTQGVPRLINQLCDLSMVYAFTNNQKTVTERTVQQVLDDGAFFCAGAFDTKDDVLE
ncbi:ExeA family protein [Roseovarius sp. EL26]|uniref:ExeA family protein n=1 Tax=Roseovarius sp. EL26 TaxID=2126672 RepID=UPI0020B12388|nr:AAA family ATPase [Roseovarius sp. EL26]